MIVAAYVRVSTRQQDLEAQTEAISRACEARGEAIGVWFREKASGRRLERAELDALRAAVRRGEIRKVYVFRIDRLGRSGIRDIFEVVDEFRRNGCKLATVADAFDPDGPAGDVVLAMLAWGAQMERQALSDRISAARADVERKGGHWGRPRRLGPIMLERARTMREKGLTIREICVALKVKRSTLSDALSGKGPYAGAERVGIK